MRRRPLLIAPALAALAAGPRADAATVHAGRTLVFPRDHGAHPAARTEWWYATGWLVPAGSAADTPPTHGFQLTFFRARGIDAPGHPSRFAATQLVFAHAALTDLGTKRAVHDQRIARAGFGVARVDEHDTAVALRDWTLVREGPPGRSVYRSRITSESGGFGFTLALEATQPLLLQGEAGFSRKGPDPRDASHYYTQPQLAVRGTVALRDGVARPMQGRAWLDHEWSDGYLPAGAAGWDWIGMNLRDGGALMAFRMRRPDGTTLWTGGTWRDAAGAERRFGDGELSFTPGRLWTSAATQARYPVEWTIDTPAGRLATRPLLDAQELDSRRSTGTVYWEGLSELLDERGTRIGLGYLEMTGYADRLRL